MSSDKGFKNSTTFIAVLLIVVACDAPSSPIDSRESPESGLFSFSFTRLSDPSAEPLTHQITGAAGEVRLAGPFGCPNLGCMVGGHASMSGPQSTDAGAVIVHLTASEGGSLSIAEPYRYAARVRVTAPGPYRVQLWLRPFTTEPAFLARDTLIHVK
jgi:hypothetical protein